MSRPKLIVMGVSGSGKSLVGRELAHALEIPFFDADAFHSEANVRKMANGEPLNDHDRAGWLADLATLIRHEDGLVLACSALKRRYRDRLRRDNPQLRFLYLKGDFETIWSRHARREDHYFNGQAMLESQFRQLEEPDITEAIRIDIGGSPESVVAQCLAAVLALS